MIWGDWRVSAPGGGCGHNLRVDATAGSPSTPRCLGWQALGAWIVVIGIAMAGWVGAVKAQSGALFDDLRDFVILDYLGTGSTNHITSPTLFAPRIDYYGKRDVPRRTMMRQRQAYYDRWPVRSYTLVEDTFRITERTPDSVDITFNYRFEVAQQNRRASGLGRTELTVRLDRDGGFTILRETGKVIDRF